jgi:hypothetical protein
MPLATEFKKDAVDYIIAIISAKDSEVINPKSISEFCSDNELCKDAALGLIALSAEAARKKDYKIAVIFDSFAATYFSDDNTFNNDRCIHALEELSGRADAKEIQNLLKTAKCKLTDNQIFALKDRIAQIAKSAEPIKGINICRLFKNEKTFNLIYIDQAKKLIVEKSYKIDSSELLDIIKRNSDENTYADILSAFVNALPYDNEFFIAAINKVKNHKSTALLEKYWKVKEEKKYFEQLINPTSVFYKEVVDFIIDKYKLFLHTKDLRQAFCKSLDSLKDNEYVSSVAEKLILKGCDIQDYYVSIILKNIHAKAVAEQIIIIDHALTIHEDQRLVEKKKELIRTLIKESNFDLAEKESKSLNGKDNESGTLLAETYFAKGINCNDPKAKKEVLFQVLDIVEKEEVSASFENSKSSTISELCSLSKEFQKEGDSESAYQIAKKINCYQSDWLSLYIELRNNDFKNIKSLVQRVKFQQETINVIGKTMKSVKLLTAITDSAYFDVWTTYETLLAEKSSSQPKEIVIEGLSNLRTQIKRNCNPIYADEKYLKQTKQLLKLKWSLATELEEDLEYDRAIVIYQEIKDEKVASYSGRAELRALICCVKSKNIDSNIEKRIDIALNFKSHELLKDDLAYRYACYLLKETRPTDAENVLRKYLSNEKTLLNLCKNIYIKESEKNLLKFNKKIKAIIEGTMSVADAITFLKDIDKYSMVISNKLTDTASKFDSYKSKIESYILRAMFSEEQYEAAFDKMMKMYPDYIEHDRQFRNIAIAALGLVELGEAKDDVLKYTISIWLSAIYTDRLFVKSLDYTSWDDPYTFTLEDSLGKSNADDYDHLPQNVNYGNPVDNQNIAIKDVQLALVSRMEISVRDKYPKFEQFFNDEKTALDDLLELNLDYNFIVASPFLANKNKKVKTSIKEALDHDVEQNYENKENVLNVGVRYGFTGGDYSSFKNAQGLAEKCKSSLSEGVFVVRAAFTSIPQIKEFDQLYSSLRAFVSSSMNEAIKNKMDYKYFLDVYEIVCKAFNEAPLSLAFSNYANGEIVQRLNNNSINLRDGVGYMVRVYRIAPSSIQVKQNLEGILSNLIDLCEEKNITADKTALQNALNLVGVDFATPIKIAQIVAKIKKGTLSKASALSQVHNMYNQTRNDDSVCELLAVLCDVCIKEYVIGRNGSYTDCSKVKGILNNINTNKSTSFRKHAKILSNEFYDLMQKVIAPDILVYAGLDPQRTLNENGRALKEGVSYYKKLGSISNTGNTIIDNLFKD